MSTKLCLACNVANPVAVKKCLSCGIPFSQKDKKTRKGKKRTRKENEKEGWIEERDKKLPEIEKREKPTKLLSKEEIVSECSYEGFAYCVYEWIMPKQIEDKKLKILWEEAKQALIKVKKELYG